MPPFQQSRLLTTLFKIGPPLASVSLGLLILLIFFNFSFFFPKCLQSLNKLSISAIDYIYCLFFIFILEKISSFREAISVWFGLFSSILQIITRALSATEYIFNQYLLNGYINNFVFKYLHLLENVMR